MTSTASSHPDPQDTAAARVEAALVDAIGAVKFPPDVLAKHPVLSAIVDVVTNSQDRAAKSRTVLTRTIEALPMQRLYVPLPDSGNKWSHFLLDKGFPKHLSYVLRRGDAVLAHSTLDEDDTPRFELKDVLDDIRKGDVWIASLISEAILDDHYVVVKSRDFVPDVCGPKNGRFFNSKYTLAFKEGESFTYLYSIYPNDCVMFDTRNLNTVNLQIQGPVEHYFTSFAAQSKLIPLLKKTDAPNEEAQRVPFIIVGLCGVHGLLPRDVTCTQRYIQ